MFRTWIVFQFLTQVRPRAKPGCETNLEVRAAEPLFGAGFQFRHCQLLLPHGCCAEEDHPSPSIRRPVLGTSIRAPFSLAPHTACHCTKVQRRRCRYRKAKLREQMPRFKFSLSKNNPGLFFHVKPALRATWHPARIRDYDITHFDGLTVTPQGFERSSISFGSSFLSVRDREAVRLTASCRLCPVARSEPPAYSLRIVLHSNAAFSGHKHPEQHCVDIDGTVSAVRVCSAANDVVIVLWSTHDEDCVEQTNNPERPGAL